ncbi:amidase, putative [Ricinus communis]|uniref:Amidase, putative n=1 Tax=Ricinus communis TaxID=3988 RepID=B9SQK2_RICCO|nr:amidase, putative [Ricinus communis]
MPSLDTVGPITRTVSDAVYLLDVIVGYDPRDHEATFEAAKYTPFGGYKQRGAAVLDNLEITNIDWILNPKRSGEFTLLIAEFKLSLNDYLKELTTSPVRSLADVIAFNQHNPDLEKPKSMVRTHS